LQTIPDSVSTFIAAARWKASKHVKPHEYTHRDWGDVEAFYELVKLIRTAGYDGVFQKRKYRYLDIGEFTYWTMGAPIEFTVIVNRQRMEEQPAASAVEPAKAALLHPKGAGLSDGQIAEHVGVSHTFVNKLRRELEQSGALATVASRTGLDGRTTDTTNIGGGQAVEAEPRASAPTGRPVKQRGRVSYPTDSGARCSVCGSAGRLVKRRGSKTETSLVCSDPLCGHTIQASVGKAAGKPSKENGGTER
jgi:hypothetical protein